MPMMRPEAPTYRSHPKVEACSIATRAVDVGRQHAVPIFLCLVLEDIPGRHRDDARADALGEQVLVSIHGKTDFTAGGDEDHLGLPAGASAST